MNEYSAQAVSEFLDYAATKGLLNKSTASAKKIAVERVFAIADAAEAADVRAVDVSNLMARFINVSGSGFKPESLASYQSRVKSAVEEFVSWKQNPMSFRPTKRGASKKARSAQEAAPPKVFAPQYLGPVPATVTAPNTLSLPIPIRSDLTVQVNGIPFDLTKSEAAKIANVILAMATEVTT